MLSHVECLCLKCSTSTLKDSRGRHCPLRSGGHVGKLTDQELVPIQSTIYLQGVRYLIAHDHCKMAEKIIYFLHGKKIIVSIRILFLNRQVYIKIILLNKYNVQQKSQYNGRGII